MIFFFFFVVRWGHFCSEHRSYIAHKFNTLFAAILEAFWLPFWSQNGPLLEVILDSFLDTPENRAPHENAVNRNEIEARALGKATKKPPTNVEIRHIV